jgi:hypothetical protein
MVKRELSLKRIYHSLCAKCDHARFRHGSYYSDYQIGVQKDQCTVEECDCMQFVSLAKTRSPYTWEAVRVHICGKVLQVESEIEKFLSNSSGKEWCGHCGEYQWREHVVEHLYKAILDNTKDDFNHIPEILELWKREARDKEQDSSMPLRNSKSCAMFRCLLCFKYIFPDDAVSPHGAGYAHKVCANKRYLVRS